MRLGEAVYRTGLFRLALQQPNDAKGALSRRLQDYLRHYLDEAGECPADLWIGEPPILLRCDLNDHMLKPFLFGEKGLYEKAEIEHCAGYLRPGDVLLDIGANHGFWSFLLAAKQPQIRQIVLIEANPTLAERLRRSKKLNPSLSVEVVNQAVCRPGVEEITFYLPLHNPVGNLSGLGSIVLHDSARENHYLGEEQAITVAATSLDALATKLQLPSIDLIKIDVEHAEDQVIEGGMEAIRRHRPRLVMMETSIDNAATKAMLEENYQYHILDSNGQRSEDIPRDFWGNLFFTPR